jgi:hypothetical protein
VEFPINTSGRSYCVNRPVLRPVQRKDKEQACTRACTKVGQRDGPALRPVQRIDKGTGLYSGLVLRPVQRLKPLSTSLIQPPGPTFTLYIRTVTPLRIRRTSNNKSPSRITQEHHTVGATCYRIPTHQEEYHKSDTNTYRVELPINASHQKRNPSWILSSAWIR